MRSYHDTPETWDTTVALDRIIGAQNTWLAGTNRSRQPAMGLTTLTALVPVSGAKIVAATTAGLRSLDVPR